MSGKSNAIGTLISLAVVIIFNLGLDVFVSSKDYSKKTLTVTC